MTVALSGLLLLFVQVAPDVEAAAQEAGVDPVLLAGAVVSTGLQPRDYLHMTGELERPVVVRPVWDSLARCESTSQWNANTGNGYYGGVQMDKQFWSTYGGLQFAPRPDLASKVQQVTVAERGLAVQGWQAWPACSRILGLR